MSFCFYPHHEHGCPNVGHCPHLGGAALGTVVLRANENEEFLRYLQGTIDAERKQNSELFEENQRLQKELDQVKLELKLERQNKFATNQQKNEEKSATKESAADGSQTKKKRGAPVGFGRCRRNMIGALTYRHRIVARTAKVLSRFRRNSIRPSTCKKT